MWAFNKILRVDQVGGGWRALAQMTNNGVLDTALLPSPTMAFATQPNDVELHIMGEQVAMKLNVALANPPTYTLSKFAFRNRFTLEERIALDNAATNAMLNDMQKATIRTILKDFESVEGPVDLQHDSIIRGVFYLEEVNLLGHERALTVLGLM